MIFITTTLLKNYVCRAPTFDGEAPSVTYDHGSTQALPRHTRDTAYCCFLPDLTGFTGSRCAGPECQHHFHKADLEATPPRVGIRPRYSGLRVQGTATSPLSTTLLV